jgi:hypothetical protein
MLDTLKGSQITIVDCSLWAFTNHFNSPLFSIKKKKWVVSPNGEEETRARKAGEQPQ